ncbi:hypothetical protein UAY_02273 [Enterococcus moraviensis ATCC BAA-383]|uniref:Lipoprotein n=1 Tax=Enterococcus moraviensis ATCC BAA-383 TaxID=1158609 RepID=R2TFT6_9ENTE|nr:YusW family protein [Enterococcus moraviensis]EOH99004.1 hypothetical protein UAY_02273 [Enterococcus moraviensis ATCC BAA-383]EOT71821.1 hypothetical protein I586_01628 [Enterococcus moraviensis ATCC BAA-383]OJG67939.1 hypothetical protein RV09_GL002050 [Enterococcus moraviensis]
MKMTHLTKSLLVAGVALSIGAAPFVGAVSASAATVISETTYEKIVSFTKDDLKQATNVQLNATTVNKMYTALKQAKAWEKLGYNAADANKIAKRFADSQYQAVGILTDIAHNEALSLKVVTINKPYFSSVNIGTTGEVTNPGTGESSTEEPNTGETGDTDESTSESNEESNKGTLSKLVKEIDVDVEYKNKDIEFKYEVKSNGTVKAKYVNEFTGEKTEGAKAQKTIEAVFEGLDAKNSSQAQIKNHVINKLGASQNFKKFDFKVKFADKSKVDFKIK